VGFEIAWQAGGIPARGFGIASSKQAERFGDPESGFEFTLADRRWLKSDITSAKRDASASGGRTQGCWGLPGTVVSSIK
jgi:hypothetical protein